MLSDCSLCVHNIWRSPSWENYSNTRKHLQHSKFQIDFQSGCSTFPRADVAFHFNPRFSSSETHIICNTLQRDQWLDEVRFSKAPLHKGESFLLLFLFLADKVKVSINGQHFIDFANRVPLCGVDTLGIYGDVTVKNISFLCSNPYHDELTEYPECKPLKLGKATMTTPFSMNIPGGLSEGHLIQVRGLATDEPHMINILLKCRDLVPFKLTANFQDQTLCYNHLTGPSWGEPQTIKTPFFLFHAERFFQILILSEKGVFKVAINGTHLGEFGPPDLDLKSINEVEINGSTMLYTVHC
ncbi:galectin-12 isoform X2 [Spea bombifrons]|uniref:galectin-12 isoform X2 n=1 Tax=Spea bombifrons TaxID=233779 RepID=UPI00234A7B39|nr:galectin-12 isoform X2 [Spea bombifrons]